MEMEVKMEIDEDGNEVKLGMKDNAMDGRMKPRRKERNVAWKTETMLEEKRETGKYI